MYTSKFAVSSILYTAWSIELNTAGLLHNNKKTPTFFPETLKKCGKSFSFVISTALDRVFRCCFFRRNAQNILYPDGYNNSKTADKMPFPFDGFGSIQVSSPQLGLITRRTAYYNSLYGRGGLRTSIAYNKYYYYYIVSSAVYTLGPSVL